MENSTGAYECGGTYPLSMTSSNASGVTGGGSGSMVAGTDGRTTAIGASMVVPGYSSKCTAK